jgi:predicted anti-sigma-YlaC factor YlaD
MSCESVDLKSYLLGEATREERAAVKAHAAACSSCREELARLETTQAALLCVREEEIPRRIGFVSDKVFEPNWWERFWRSGSHLAFAGAAMLALAIVVHGFAVRPPAVAPGTAVAKVEAADIDARVSARLDKAVADAVAKAVANSEQRQQERTAELLATAEKKHQMEMRTLQVAFEEDSRMRMKQLGTLYVAVNRMEPGGGQ